MIVALELVRSPSHGWFSCETSDLQPLQYISHTSCSVTCITREDKNWSRERKREAGATEWEIDGETETEWLWHWSLSHWAALPVDDQWTSSVSLGTGSGPWPAVEQRRRGELGVGASRKTGVKRPSLPPLFHFVPVSVGHSVRLETLRSINTHQVISYTFVDFKAGVVGKYVLLFSVVEMKQKPLERQQGNHCIVLSSILRPGG